VVRKRLGELGSAPGILLAVADLTRRLRQDHGDIMRVVLATAPNDAEAAEGLAGEHPGPAAEAFPTRAARESSV
jgi:hypothetical protein